MEVSTDFALPDADICSLLGMWVNLPASATVQTVFVAIPISVTNRSVHGYLSLYYPCLQNDCKNLSIVKPAIKAMVSSAAF